MRKSLAFYLCLFLILAGCSNTSTSPSPQPLNPTGTYIVTYTEQSGGTCGPEPGSTITIAGSSPTYTWTETAIPVATQGSFICTADHCTINVSLTGGGVTERYNVTTTSTGMTGTQAATITGTGACSSTYNVTGTKK